MLHWKPDLHVEVQDTPPPSQMMRQQHRPFWAALRRHLLACDDAIGWACLGAGAGLLLYMAIGLLLAWIGGRIG